MKKRKKWLAALLAMTMTFSLVSPSGLMARAEGNDTGADSPTAEEISEWIMNDKYGIPDTALYNAILEAADGILGDGKDGILTKAEALKLEDLNADSVGIKDLQGIEYCANLMNLGLMNNEISNISSLSSLTNLEFLYLTTNEISDISSLSGLINLRHLYLNNNKISDISVLPNLTSLEFVDLSYNRITDFSVLDTLPNLEYNIDGNTSGIISNDETGILDKNLYQAVLAAADSNKDGVLTVSEAEALKSLSAKEANIINLSGIEYCKNIGGLYLSGNEITDISLLAKLSNLQYIDLSGNNIGNVNSLSGLKSLKALNLSDNNIANTDPLSALSGLESLNLSNNPLISIEALKGLTNLVELSLEYNELTEVYSLSGLMNLTTLSLGNNQINDASPLTELSALTVLKLNHNQISNVEPFVKMPKLVSLDLSYNRITDASALNDLELEYLNLEGNLIVEIPEITPIQGSGTIYMEKGMPFQLGKGTWKVEGDSTFYNGDVMVYAAKSGDYKFVIE